MDVDWQKGVFETGLAGDGPDWRMTVAGDWAPIRDHEQHMLASPEGIYGNLLPVLRGADVRVANFECVLGDCGRPIPKGGPNLRGPEEALEAFTAVPFDVACMANNHTRDFDDESLAHTLGLLDAAGVWTVGAGMSAQEAARPCLLTVHGVRVAILDCAEGEECRSRDGGAGGYGFEPDLIADHVMALKDCGAAEVVVVVFHGGREHTPMPPPYVVAGLREVADAGADAVIAHHPHVPQGIEMCGGVPIAYSLGNFCFWQSSELFFRRSGYLMHLDFAGAELQRASITPYLIEAEGLRLMPETVRGPFMRDLRHVSDLLADPEAVDAAWDAFIDSFGADAHLRNCKAVLKVTETDRVQAAASLLNVLRTPAHHGFVVRACQRVTRGEEDTSPEWARELVARWTTLRYDEIVK